MITTMVGILHSQNAKGFMRIAVLYSKTQSGKNDYQSPFIDTELRLRVAL